MSRTVYRLAFPRRSLAGNVLRVTVGLSHASAAGADLNAPPPETTLATARAAATARWDAALGKIRIVAGAEETAVFYTALYHALLGPTLFSDADGSFSSGRSTISRSEGATYSTFSLWDTFRAQAPLLDLLSPELAEPIAESLLAVAGGGDLPRWVLFGKETGCMSGYPAAVVLADAALKRSNSTARFSDDLLERVGAAMTRTARAFHPALRRESFIPAREGNSVARALEAAVADACIARFAEAFIDGETAREFEDRSRLYRLYFDADRGLMSPRSEAGFEGKDGERYDPRGAFEEGTPLQYTFMVPADAEGLAELLGGSLEQGLDIANFKLLFDRFNEHLW